jgi:chromosome segregation ATPase
MYWLNMEWIAANWMPLVVALILGFILGWLLTGLSPRRKNAEYEAQLAELESKSRKTERDLGDARKQVDSLKGAVATTEGTLGDVRKQLTDAQADTQRLGDEKAAVDADLQSSNIELADLKMQLALMQDQFDKTKSSAVAEGEQLHASVDAAAKQIADLNAERDAVAAERDAIAAELAAVRNSSDSALHSLSTKDAALNEAYQRAVNLQRALEDREAALTAAQAELSSLRVDVSALNSIKAELENRLQSARGDVAGEMAVLTSTMIKMKDEQVTTANARIAELMNEINALKSHQAAG